MSVHVGKGQPSQELLSGTNCSKRIKILVTRKTSLCGQTLVSGVSGISHCFF